MIKISAFSAIAFFNKKLPEPPHTATFLIGLLITLNNLVNLIFVIIFFLIVRNLFVLKEEVQMEETFGEEYLSYKKKVRRWL